MAVEEPIILAEDIHKFYRTGPTRLHVLRGISLRVMRGEMVAVMGPSGSGKSTLLHILGCLDVPDRGRYLLGGVEVGALDEEALAAIRRKKVGFVFQRFFLLPRLNALDNVALPMAYAGVPGRERKRRAAELLEMVGLGDRAGHRPNQLSGGESQRVAIARALANNPEVLLADEPTGNLDTKTGREIMELISKLNRERGMTVVLVTHDPEIASWAHRVLSIRDGVITESRP